MTHTAPRVSFGLYSLVTKADSVPSASNIQPFSKPADLITDNATGLPYATYEQNFWLLDGNYKFLPADLTTVHVGIMSTAMSDGSGNFAVPPVLTIDFSTVHTTDGLTLHFSQFTGDYATSINVKYYNASAGLILSADYTPTSWEFTVAQVVTNFKQIVITFNSTSRPYRYLRLSNIDYGELIYFSGATIKGASIVEETDPISIEVRHDTFSVKIYSKNAAFSIINPTGYYVYLQSRQPLAVYEDVGTRSIFMGHYYLDTWENKSETEIILNCVDLLGVCDTITFNGDLYTGQTIENVLAGILDPLYLPYNLDPTLVGTTLTGWIPMSSVREALQHIAFAVGAYVDCSRSGAIKIYKSPMASDTPTVTITKSQKGMGGSVTLKPLVTGVEVTAHNYVSVSTSKQVYNGTLAAGSYKITFGEPLHTLSATGATIASSGVNYAVLTVSSPGTVTLSGQTYLDTTQIFSVYNTGLDASVKPNILRARDATLVNSSNGAAVAQRVYNYHQQRLLQKTKLYAPTDVEPMDVVLIDSLYGQHLSCVVEKMSTNLFGGMVSQVEMTGVTV